MYHHDLMIYGTGMVGLSTALYCAKAGFKLAVVGDKPCTISESTRCDHRYSTINRRSQKLFKTLDVWEKMRLEANPYTRMVVWDSQGLGPLSFEAEAMDEPDLGHVMANAWILETLWEAVSQHPNIQCYHSRAVLFHRDSRDLSLGLEDGTQVKAPLAIGADGAQSWLRKVAGIELKTHDYQQSTLVTKVRSQKTHDYTAWQRFLPQGPIAFLPLKDPYESIVLWTTSPKQIQDQIRFSECTGGALIPGTGNHRIQGCMPPSCIRKNVLDEMLTYAIDQQLGTVVSLHEPQVFPLKSIEAKTSIAERVALVGDAMHVIHPLAGQGLNLGLADIEPLVQTLEKASARHLDLGNLQVLRPYARARKGAVCTMRYGMTLLNDLFCSKHSALVIFRTLGLEAVQKMPWLKKQLAFQAMGL